MTDPPMLKLPLPDELELLVLDEELPLEELPLEELLEPLEELFDPDELLPDELLAAALAPPSLPPPPQPLKADNEQITAQTPIRPTVSPLQKRLGR